MTRQIRSTESSKIEANNEAAALGFFEEALHGSQDPRWPQGPRYPLRTVVVSAPLPDDWRRRCVDAVWMVCGCDDAEAMECWSAVNKEWLAGFLDMPHGSPTHVVYLSVLGALEPAAFRAVFVRWAELVSLRLGEDKKHIAIDGKTSRRSMDRKSGRAAIHTVGAWLCGAGLVLGQTQTREKSNEIIAIPELLKVISLRGATVTGRSMNGRWDVRRRLPRPSQDDGGTVTATNYWPSRRTSPPLPARLERSERRSPPPTTPGSRTGHDRGTNR